MVQVAIVMWVIIINPLNFDVGGTNMRKIIVAVLLANALILSSSCSEITMSSLSQTESEESDYSTQIIPTDYDPANASTIPDTLPSPIPDNWEVISEENYELGTMINYEEKITYEDGEVRSQYTYNVDTKKLVAFYVVNNRESYLNSTDRAVYSKAQLKEMADEFLSQKVPLDNYTAWGKTVSLELDGPMYEGHTFEYYFDSFPGQWIMKPYNAGGTEIKINKFGDIIAWHTFYSDIYIDIDIPDISLKDIEERMRSEDSYSVYLDYYNEFKDTYSFWEILELISYIEVDGEYVFAFTPSWEIYDEELKCVASEKYVYLFSDYQ